MYDQTGYQDQAYDAYGDQAYDPAYDETQYQWDDGAYDQTQAYDEGGYAAE